MSTGIGVLIQTLRGDRGEDLADYRSKVVESAVLEGNEILIKFEGGVGIKIFDAGQSCCESRYITTDDDLSSLVGQTLVAIIEKPVTEIPNEETYEDVHEVAFVEIQTPTSTVTLETHVEHNGYYGGFWLKVEAL